VDRLTILGGGSPFTLGLVEALVARSPSPPLELMLYGRDPAVLGLVRQYAASRLRAFGWEVEASTHLLEALAGARYVVHQIRYGGLDGRREDELIASRFGAAADETLGPGALNSALRMAAQLRVLARAIASVAPDAWVLNLTNPLSVATSILSEEGVTRCIGLCELPSSTAGMVARVLDLPLSRLDWCYQGLNHRGFIVGLECDGQDQLSRLLLRLGDGNLGGIPAAVIAKLGAVPTKYFDLVYGASGPAPGRAEYVRALRDRIVQELRSAPHVLPPSLGMRGLPWYAESVVPSLASLRSAKPRRLVVNLPCGDGITRELHAELSATGVTGQAPAVVPQPVANYLEKFELHERRVLEAVAEPCYETIASALAADPTVKPEAGSTMAAALWENHTRRSEVSHQLS